MTTEVSFLCAMLEEPDDLNVRLICADWLEDQADPVLAARGEFLRLQCQLARWVPDLKQRTRMQKREQQLLREHQRTWLGDLPNFCREWQMEGGLLRITMPLDDFLNPAFAERTAELFRNGWVQTVRLEGASRRLAGAEHLALVSCLDLSGNHLDDEAVRTLLVSRHLQGLRGLNLANNNLTDAVVGMLAAPGILEGLTWLDLRNNHLRWEIENLLQSPLGRRLRQLDLHGNLLDETALELWLEWRKERLPVGALPARLINSIGMELVLIPAGSFKMGSPARERSRHKHEGPLHEVTITRPFYMGAYQVTHEQFTRVTGTFPSHFDEMGQGSPQIGASETLWFPVESVRIDQAQEFCRLLSTLPGEMQRTGSPYRLPTEAEWEYACRAGSTTPFNCGRILSSRLANFDSLDPHGTEVRSPSLQQVTPVGCYPANAFGLYDMHGNCWDWCSDWYDEDYYARSPCEDPPGPSQGILRVIRGGSWSNPARVCRSAARHGTSDSGSYCISFRVVLPVG